MPQNSCAKITTTSSSLPPVSPSASTKICAGGTVAPTSVPYFWMANVTPISKLQPANSDTAIEVTMPRGPDTDADLVSSVMCADASYPVNVYWASSRQSSVTYSRELQPVLFTKRVNTNDADWWCDGANVSAPTISSTPRMCRPRTWRSAVTASTSRSGAMSRSVRT